MSSALEPPAFEDFVETKGPALQRTTWFLNWDLFRVNDKRRRGYSVDRTCAGQTALQGRFARGRSRLGGWPGEEGGLGGTRFGCGSATRSR